MGNERRPRRGAYGVPYTLPLWRYGPAAVRGRPHQRRKRRMSGTQGAPFAPGLLVPTGTRQLRGHIRAVAAGHYPCSAWGFDSLRSPPGCLPVLAGLPGPGVCRSPLQKPNSLIEPDFVHSASPAQFTAGACVPFCTLVISGSHSSAVVMYVYPPCNVTCYAATAEDCAVRCCRCAACSNSWQTVSYLLPAKEVKSERSCVLSART